MLVIHFEVYNTFRLEWIIASNDYSDYGDYPAEESIPIPSKTRPRPCDMEIDLYEMQPMEPEPIKGKLSKCSDRSCDKQFIVQSVPRVQPGDAGGVHGLQLLQPARTPAAQGGGARRGHLLQPELPAPHAPGCLHQLPRRRSGTETTVWPRPYPPGICQPAAFSVATACNLLVLLLGMNRRLLADLPPTHNGRPAAESAPMLQGS
uniref:Putative voltage-dependent calcium channel subunit alpha-2/delta-4-like protein n=1 Tax=Ixodes ricinus TaxID=34613 RepID=A0A0K8R8K8_IXORI